MMKKIAAASLPAACFVLPILLSAGAAHAQSAAPEDAGKLTDIVVTASKRETTAQRTPVALNAFEAKDLAQSGANDLRALQNVSPTLQIGTSGTNTLIAIRGVSSRDATEIGDPAVAVSVDNFYFQRAAALNASVFDVDRVEVLRGPQGTLYGRNAEGGAINISTVKPELGKVAGFGTIEYGNYNALRVEGAVNLPLSDTLAVRASFISSSRDGYSNNPGVARNGDDDDTKGARLHILYKPTDRLSFLLTGEYNAVGGVGPIVYGQPFTYTSAGTVSHADQDIASRDSWALNTQGSLDIRAKSIRGQISYEFDFATLSYFGGFRHFIYHRTNDVDGRPENTSAHSLSFPQNEDEKTQNHELRLTSPGNQPFTWQAGLYYFKEQNDLLSYFGPLNVTPFSWNRTFTYDVGAESKAAFAQAGYRLSDQLQVEAGLRYSDDSKYRVGTSIVSGVTTAQNSHTKNNKLTWHLGINAQITPQNLLYAKADTGYKSGGFTDLNQYGPESLTAYEIGSKNRFLDDSLQVNLSAFYYDYTDLQVTQLREDGRQIVTNAGKSEIYGVELETIYNVTPVDRIDFSANYLHAEYKDFRTAVGSVNVSYAGNTMIQSPRWSLTGGYQHSFDFAGGELTARVQSHYQTRQYFTYRQQNSESEKAFSKTDFTLNYQPDDQPWSLLFFVRNIEDKRVMTDATEYTSFSANVYRYQFSEPRTYGGRLTYKF